SPARSRSAAASIRAAGIVSTRRRIVVMWRVRLGRMRISFKIKSTMIVLNDLQTRQIAVFLKLFVDLFQILFKILLVLIAQIVKLFINSLIRVLIEVVLDLMFDWR